MATTRYLADELVYDTEWVDECCPYGRAMHEAPSHKGKRPKNLYMIASDRITRKIVCPLCEAFYQTHPLCYGTLNKAVSALRAQQTTNRLLNGI